MTLSADFSWLKVHAVLLLLVVGISLAGIYEIEHLVAKHDAATAAQAESALRTVTDQVAVLETTLKTDEASFQQVNAAQLALISQLNLRISARDQTTQQTVKADTSLSAIGAASKIESDLGTSNEVTAQADSVVLDLSAARLVTQRLDTLPTVESDLADTQTQLTAEEKIATDNAADATEEKAIIALMQTQVADGTKACTAQIDAVKAADNKSKLKWFFIGVVAFIGVVLR